MVQLQESFQTQGFYLGLESAYATAVAADKRLLSISAPFTPMIETETFTPSGDTAPSIVVINDEYVSLSVTGKPDFNGMTYMAASVWGPDTPSNPGSGDTYVWQFDYDGRTVLAPASYTAIYGTTGNARQSAGVVFSQYGMSVSRSGIDLTASGFGKEMTQGIGAFPRNEVQTVTVTGTPTGGDFTLTYSGQTTTALTFDESAADVQSALEALSNLAPGDVVVTGGPAPGTPFVLTFGGTLANTDVDLLTATPSLTGGSTPGVTITETTKGGDVTDISAQVLFPGYFDVYLDDTWANLGTTKLLYCYDLSITTAERLARTRPINSTKSSDGLVETENQQFMVNMTLGVDATQEAVIDDLRAGNMVFVRLDANGPTIDANGDYLCRHDMALLLTDVGAFQSTDGVHTIPITAQLGRDDTSGLACQVTLNNTLATL